MKNWDFNTENESHETLKIKKFLKRSPNQVFWENN